MKTQIIQLNQNDDFISVQDKMNWSQTGRILLIWPHLGNPLSRQYDLNRVDRHARSLGAQLALVTQLSDVRSNAQLMGIPVFDDLRRAQRSHWSESKHNLDRNYHHLSTEDLRKALQPQPPGWLNLQWVRVTCFLSSVLALFSLGIFILPGATIALRPDVKIQTMTLSMAADPSLTIIKISTESLPTYGREVIVEGTDSLIATGSVVIPNQFANGSLRFTNISDHKVSIPEATVVTTMDSNPIRFFTSRKGETTLATGRSVIIAAQAMAPGTSGNLPAGKLVAIEGQLGLDLTVTNPSSTHGGTNASVPSPTKEDLNLLKERLETQLKQAALSELQARLSKDDILISASLKIIDVVEETCSPAIGEPGRQLNLSIRLRSEGQVVSGEYLSKLVTPVLDANNSTSYAPIPGSLVFSSQTPATIGKDGNSNWTMQAERKIQADISDSQVIAQIKGSLVSNALETLYNSFPLAEEPQIILSPNWWPWMPLLPMRIKVLHPYSE